MDGVSPPHQRILSLAKGKGHVHDGHLTHRHVEEGEGETLQTGHQAWKKKTKTFTVIVLNHFQFIDEWERNRSICNIDYTCKSTGIP